MSKTNLMPEGFKPPKGPKFKTLMTAASVLTGLFLVIYFALLGYQIVLNRQKNNINQQMQSIQQEVDNKLGSGTMDLQNKLNTFKQLLDNHVYWSDILTIIEKSTLPSMQFNSFSADTQNETVALQGRALNYSFLAKQVVAFEKKFDKVEFSTQGLAKEGGISFNMQLKIKPGLLNRNETRN